MLVTTAEVVASPTAEELLPDCMPRRHPAIAINTPYAGDVDNFCCSDDIVTMGLQASTHWDSLAHVSYGGLLYNVAGIEDRIELIVRFLAVLELFKQGVVDLTQVVTFGDLVVRRLPEGARALDDVSLDDWDDVPAPVG